MEGNKGKEESQGKGWSQQGVGGQFSLPPAATCTACSQSWHPSNRCEMKFHDIREVAGGSPRGRVSGPARGLNVCMEYRDLALTGLVEVLMQVAGHVRFARKWEVPGTQKHACSAS